MAQPVSAACVGTAQHAKLDALVKQYAPLVKRIAYHLMAKLPASVQVEDIVQNGMLGLLDAINRFEEVLGAQFATYAAQRIRGAMLDGLRENDWLPRSLRRDMRRIENAIHALEQSKGRPPSETELAEALGMPLADYQEMLAEAHGHQIVYLDDIGFHHEEGYLDRTHLRHITISFDLQDPLQILLKKERDAHMTAAIADLPEREKLVMGLYYEQDLNLREIGEVLG